MKKIKIRLLLSLLVCISVLISGVSLAWLYVSRNLDNLGMIKAPVRLELRAGALESVEQFDLGEIDVTSPERSQSYVFAVYGDKGSQYKIQLAYTTNIPFTYEVYTAKQYETEESGNAAEEKTAADVAYRSQEGSGGKTYYYYKKTKVPYQLVNANGTVAKATGDYHNLTYGTGVSDTGAYSHVQEHAEPMYWQSEQMYTLGREAESIQLVAPLAAEYYILTVSWTEEQITSGQIANNKETDMIYITVGQEKKSSNE